MAVTPSDKVVCLECGLLFRSITNTHLASKHNMTTGGYRQLHPKAVFESDTTKEINDSNRKAVACLPQSMMAKSNNGKANKGKKRTAIWINTRSKLYSGEGNPFFGKTHSLEVRKKLSVHFQGISENDWSGFTKPESVRVWKSKKAKHWSKAVLSRDDYTCKMCHRRGSDMEAHHIKTRSARPDLVYDLSNGVCLCIACHRSIFNREEEFEFLFTTAVKSDGLGGGLLLS